MTATLEPLSRPAGDDDPAVAGRPRAALAAAALAAAVVGGGALGAIDLFAQVVLPLPWAPLANSSAVWALVAFAAGLLARGRLPAAVTAGAGAVLLVVAVEAYYLVATAVLGDDLAMAWAPSTGAWVLFGLLAGPLFALAGSWCGRAGVRGVVGPALASAVCSAEFVVALVRVDAASGGGGASGGAGTASQVLSAALLAALGVAVLLASARSLLTAGRAMLVSVPLAALGVAGFAAGGFLGPGWW